MLNFKSSRKYIYALVVFIFIFLYLGFSKGTQGRLEIWFFDVGQGDAVLIRTPSDHQILIDGGPDNTILEKLGNVLPFWDKSLDLVILTHPHSDHLTGVVEVQKRYEVDRFITSGVEHNTAVFKEWRREIDKEPSKIIRAWVGQKIEFDDGVVLEILGPDDEMMKDENLNNTSIVLKLTYKDLDVLFTGDAEMEAQGSILDEGSDLESEVLKMPHQGSKDSASPEFLEAVAPEIVVISVGKDNSYGHPHKETLELLSGIRVLRTDLMGDIKIWATESEYFIKSSY